MVEEAKFRKNSEATPVEMMPGITRRTLAFGEKMLIAEVALKAGSKIPPHSHPHEQVGYVAKGRMRITFGPGEEGEKTADASTGDGYSVPGGLAHAVEALEDTVAIDIFSPVREEYK